MENQIWWEDIEGSDLGQGDYLEACPVVMVLDSFDPAEGKESDVIIEVSKVLSL